MSGSQTQQDGGTRRGCGGGLVLERELANDGPQAEPAIARFCKQSSAGSQPRSFLKCCLGRLLLQWQS